MIYSLLGFYLNWRAYNVFTEGHPRRWEVTLSLHHRNVSLENTQKEKKEIHVSDVVHDPALVSRLGKGA